MLPEITWTKIATNHKLCLLGYNHLILNELSGSQFVIRTANLLTMDFCLSRPTEQVYGKFILGIFKNSLRKYLGKVNI